MARYKIILAYDGTLFLGSQRQRASRTVQGELEKSLRKLGWDEPTVYMAGRTDTGTHASGQVAAFDLNWNHGVHNLQKALNTHLPRDMVVRETKIVSDSFHPRFDAISRSYRYRLFCSPVRDPLRERYAWRVWPEVADLTHLGSIWDGRHDFGAFGTPPRKDGNTMRTVFAATWSNKCDEWTFDIQADAFLFRMVRRLVYVQVAAGQGRIPVENLVRALKEGNGLIRGTLKDGQDRIPASIAPASGLTLVEVCYENVN